MGDPPAAPTDPMSRFKSDGAASSEEQLKTSTVGLVTLSDFRKRRLEALDESDATSDTSSPAVKFNKKKRKAPKKGALSFATDDGDDEGDDTGTSTPSTRPATTATSRASTPRPNDIAIIARPQTASALARDAAAAEVARKAAAQVTARIKATPFLVPFCIFEGPGVETAAPEAVRVTKGAQVWEFLERARKVGAASGIKREWARKGADDLMAVVDDLILPHHYEFFWFMRSAKQGFTRPLFRHSADVTAATPETVTEEERRPGGLAPGLTLPGQKRKDVDESSGVPDAELEGVADEPAWVKVVDRRWYEKSRHVFPMNSWEEFDPDRDYESGVRKDRNGNAYFNLKTG